MDELDQTIVDMYINKRMSGDAVGWELGHTSDWVYARLERLGIPRRNNAGNYTEPGTCCECGKPWSEEEFYPSCAYRCKTCKDAYTAEYRKLIKEIQTD